MTQVPTRPPDATVAGLAAAGPPAREAGEAGASGVRRLTTGVIFPVAAAVLAALALRAASGLSDLQQVGAGLIVAAAVSAAVLARSAERTPQWQLAAGTLGAAAAFAC
jgi:hypothetical protein